MSDRPGEMGVPDILADLDLPRVPQQARSREKRDAILAAATRLFAELGYDATTTKDIAAAAGVSIGALYRYFRDKRQIFLSLFADNVATVQTLGQALRDFGPEPRRTMRQALARAIPHDATQYGLQRAWSTLLHRDPGSAGYGAQIHQLLYEHLLSAVRQAASEGRTWPDLDIEATCWTVTQLLDHVWHTQLDPTTLTEPEFVRQRDAVADLIYHAIFRDG